MTALRTEFRGNCANKYLTWYRTAILMTPEEDLKQNRSPPPPPTPFPVGLCELDYIITFSFHHTFRAINGIGLLNMGTSRLVQTVLIWLGDIFITKTSISIFSVIKYDHFSCSTNGHFVKKATDLVCWFHSTFEYHFQYADTDGTKSKLTAVGSLCVWFKVPWVRLACTWIVHVFAAWVSANIAHQGLAFTPKSDQLLAFHSTYSSLKGWKNILFEFGSEVVNPSSPKSDQCQISPSASPGYHITQYEELGFL